MTIEVLLNNMWNDYCALNPSAKAIYDLFGAEGENVLNDHIALRTFRHPRLGIESMAKTFMVLGYREVQDYHFTTKKLYAKHYEHRDETKPKIFISELLVDQMSVASQKVINTLVAAIPDAAIQQQDFCYSGRTWGLSSQTYELLADESEYAAWVAAIGFRPNHFTVYVNAMKQLNTIQKVNQFLEAKGIVLNASGGKIKGTPSELVEQSSTMAELISVKFDEGVYQLPGCYYEFARRYADANGKLYQGFIAASADKIFESTNRM
jgi:hypothetical protein